ncbi:glycoside hydrolase family 15 protein [Ramlibacter sp.]|uniref:glycoside hydrolase family 15 protein n=1 Tax=Ramlibacter sp. TaxID=1917967 RepID=UPI002D73FC46|nr:glycoside hydrolase family 15 protein [Ramlibacter sp.]HYD75798.1 glycoside hydrolase family 15 protein [Ramlibacter sp.]
MTAFIPFPDPVADCSIADYGAIGDCRTVALVSRFGSIDWWCSPDFASPSCFASLLDRERGGRFALTPRGVREARQAYLPRTNVLQTRFTCEGGELELTDFMPLPEAGGAGAHGESPQEIVRRVRCLQGEVTLEALFDPRPDYARARVRIDGLGNGQWRCSGGGFEAQLSTTLPLEPAGGGALRGSLRMRAGEVGVALLHAGAVSSSSPDAAHEDVHGRLAATVAWWGAWCDLCTYRGEYAGDVMRSALALKLLAHRPTGAVVAAATTSLPESEAGGRNWDYRYCWLRDTSLVLHAFTDLGYSAESRAFSHWLLHATRATRPKLNALYGVHGETDLAEVVLPHLRGYHGIGPVRIGNAAAGQLQHDAYGEVILTNCDDIEMGGSLDEHEKDLLAEFTDQVCRIWRQPDHGIWEIRLPPRHNVHSKLMCWAALDRALQLHRDHGLPIDAQRVAREREAVRAGIEAQGWNDAVGSYVGYYGSDAPDTSVLLMPRLGYIDARHPRMRGTVDHVLRTLSSQGLLYRYPPGTDYDGVAGPEHLFAISGFWCVDCLARQGRLQEARAMYERLLALRNPLGLFAEEYAASDLRPMGNFPQAFSHVGAITAALSLDRAGRGEPAGQW